MSPLVFPLPQTPASRVARGKAPVAASAPRLSNATLRVPDPWHNPIEIAFPSGHPQIFVHEGARQALERRLSMAYRLPLILSVTDNRRHMISLSRRHGIVRARLHHMFLDAPSRVQEALIRYVVGGHRESSLLVNRYIEANGHRIRASRPVRRQLSTKGEHHDLFHLFQVLNKAYFGGSIDALITWGRRLPRSHPRGTIKLGSYSAVERLIRIHPVLDRPWVPRYFVSYIVYHEMLHHVIPAGQDNGRRVLHPRVFSDRERLFRDFERALKWEKAHVARLLRA